MATTPVWENRLPLAAARNRLNGKKLCRILESPIRKTMSPSRSTARPHRSHRVISGVITIEGSRPSARARAAAGPRDCLASPVAQNRSERSRTSWAWAPKRISQRSDPEHGRPRDGGAWGSRHSRRRCMMTMSPSQSRASERSSEWAASAPGWARTSVLLVDLRLHEMGR